MDSEELLTSKGICTIFTQLSAWNIMNKTSLIEWNEMTVQKPDSLSRVFPPLFSKLSPFQGFHECLVFISESKTWDIFRKSRSWLLLRRWCRYRSPEQQDMWFCKTKQKIPIIMFGTNKRYELMRVKEQKHILIQNSTRLSHIGE